MTTRQSRDKSPRAEQRLTHLAEDPRPLLGPAIETLLSRICQQVEGLQHVDPRRVLVVSAQARGQAWASIRGLQGVSVHVGGWRRDYELSLRPRWFRQATMERRLESLVHELWHIDPAGKGALDAGHRHRPEDKTAETRALQRLLRQALDIIEPRLLAALGHHGELLLPTWLQRPVLVELGRGKKTFSDKDLFLQPVMMLSPKTGRTVWW